MKTKGLGLVSLAALSLLSGRVLAQTDGAAPAAPADSAPAVSAPADGGAAAVGTADSTVVPDVPTSGGAPAAGAVDSSAPDGGTSSGAAASSEIFDDRFYVAPTGSMAISRRAGSFGDAFGGGLAIGKSLIPHLSVEVLGDYLYYKGKNDITPGTGLVCGILATCPDVNTRTSGQSIYSGGLGFNGYASSSNYGLFVHADAQEGNHFVWNSGLGVDLPMFGQVVALRVEALYHKEADVKAEPLYKLGLRIPLGSVPGPAAAPPEPPTQVVPVEEPAPAAPPPPPPPPPCQPPAPGQPISLEGCKTGDTLVLHGVNFEFNKATLTLNAKTLLDQVADALLSRKDIKVEIDGHTDGKGTVPYNQKLSDARAASVRQYLIGRGIEAGRMTSKGFGKSMPIASNDTDEGREQNRRVELKVTETGADGAAASGAAAAVAAPAPAEAAPPAHAHKKHHKAAVAATPAADSSAPADAPAAPAAEGAAPAAAEPSATPAASAPSSAGQPAASVSSGDAATAQPSADGGTSQPPEEDAKKVSEQPDQGAPASSSSGG